MSKYIDADKLKAEIERLKKHSQEAKMEFMEEGYSQNAFAEDCRLKSFDKLLSFIDSLQQEQPEFPTTDEEVEKVIATIPKVELPDKYKTPDWLFKQQEQPEVDLRKEVTSNFNVRKEDEK